MDLPWMDALRIEFALGYSVELTLQGIPRNMIRLSPLDTYHGEYFVHKWLLDTREIVRHGLEEVGILIKNAWYTWTLGRRLDFSPSVDMTIQI